jgi:hypothetical protein
MCIYSWQYRLARKSRSPNRAIPWTVKGCPAYMNKDETTMLAKLTGSVARPMPEAKVRKLAGLRHARGV